MCKYDVFDANDVIFAHNGPRGGKLIPLQRVTSVRRCAQANAPAASFWSSCVHACRRRGKGRRRDQTSPSCKRCGHGAGNSHYRLRTDIPWCVMQSVGYICEPSIMAGPIEALFWNVDSGVSKEPCIEWRVQIPTQKWPLLRDIPGQAYTKLFASWQHVVMRPYATITVATCDVAIGYK